MLTTIAGFDISSNEALMMEAFRFRHAVFVEERGWEDLRRPDGLETDAFDDAHTIHQICRRDGEIVGYQRLRPTLEPHMLSEVFGDLCRTAPPTGRDIWEWSRFAISSCVRVPRPHRNDIFLELTQGVVEWCLGHDIHATTVLIDLRLMVVAMQLKFDVRPLGYPTRIGREDVVPLKLSFDRETLRTVREARGVVEMPSRSPVPAKAFS